MLVSAEAVSKASALQNDEVTFALENLVGRYYKVGEYHGAAVFASERIPDTAADGSIRIVHVDG